MTGEEKEKEIKEVREMAIRLRDMIGDFLEKWKPKLETGLTPKEMAEVFTQGAKLKELKKLLDERMERLMILVYEKEYES